MKVESVHESVRRIEAMSGDDEAAHSAEDALHQSVLQAIADGAADAPALATAALATRQLDFARWCA